MANYTLADYVDEVIQFHYDVAYHAAETARDILTNEAVDAIDRFYDSYCGPHKPLYYRRMFRNFGYSGGRASKRSYDSRVIVPILHVSPKKTVFSGGVELRSDKMFDDYQDSVDTVFWDVLKGYHGPRFYSPVPPMKESPIESIERAWNAIDEQFDFYMRQSVDYVKKNNNYKILKF